MAESFPKGLTKGKVKGPKGAATGAKGKSVPPTGGRSKAARANPLTQSNKVHGKDKGGQGPIDPATAKDMAKSLNFL